MFCNLKLQKSAVLALNESQISLTFLDWCTLNIHTLGVSAMGPHLLVEAGGVSDVALWELLRLHPLLPGGQETALIMYSRH